MSTSAARKQEPAPIRACTISRDIQNFDLLIEDMEAELGEGWGDLSFEEARTFFDQPEAEALDFVAIAVDEEDEERLEAIGGIVAAAKERRIRVILVADELGPMALHQLLRLGANDFLPYPLPEGALHEAIERLNAPAAGSAAPANQPAAPVHAPGSGRDGTVLAVQGLAGGVGASTFAVNLAWELARPVKGEEAPRVCLLDFDLQFGSAATYLDLERPDAVFELLSDVPAMDAESFMQAMRTFGDRLKVLTAPADILPLDLIGPEEVQALLAVARANFDFVIVEVPRTIVHWTETVLGEALAYFVLMELDMRSAQNTLRLIRALKAEDLPVEKLRFVLNRAPKLTDLSGKSRAKRMAENLDIEIGIFLPDGGRQIVQAGDHGIPLAETQARNLLRREIQKLAESLKKQAAEAAAAST